MIIRGVNERYIKNLKYFLTFVERSENSEYLNKCLLLY